MHSKKIAVVLSLLFFNFSHRAFAGDMTLNLGYQNPPGALVGINFLTFWSKWALEFGIGWVDVESSDTNKDEDKADDTFSTRIGGDVNLKYFFTSGTARVYAQGGLGVGLAASVGEQGGAGAGAAGPFGGLGVLFGSNKFYGYGAFNLASYSNGFLQLGIGFDI